MSKTSVQVRSNRKRVKYSTRRFHSCGLCGRTKAYMRRYGLCRICFRERANRGEIPGVKKVSW